MLPLILTHRVCAVYVCVYVGEREQDREQGLREKHFYELPSIHAFNYNKKLKI